jgi:FSR family fosmidomycin resistance protein-like MFS transporter
MASLSAGHLATDLAQGAIPALLVYLANELDLSYTLAGAVVLVATFSSSIVQPVFGHWSDRRGAQWLLPGGALLAGIGIALASVAPNYPLLLVAIFFSGIGVAAYHPEGSKFAAYVSGTRRASGMSAFSVGGNLGFGLGPVIAAGLVIAFGLPGGLLLVVPGAIVAALLIAERRHLASFIPAGRSPGRISDGPSRPRAFALLQGIVSLRSIAHYGLFTFIPLWEHDVRAATETQGTLLLTLFLVTGAVGTLIGGPLADRVGRRPVVIVTELLAVPLLVTYILVGGAVGYVALALAGGAIVSTLGITTVMSQEYLPGRIGTASGLSTGLAIGIGGIFAVTLGGIGDTIGLEAALLACAAAPGLAGLLALALPKEHPARLLKRPATI